MENCISSYLCSFCIADAAWSPWLIRALLLVCGTLALFLGTTSYGTFVYSSGSGAFLGETSKHVIQLSLPSRNLCGMDAAIKILLFHEELQGLCLICKVLIYHFPDQLICSQLCHMILIIQDRRIYQPSYVCGLHHVTTAPHILEGVALSWCCVMFLLLACDDEKCCYRKYTEQH